MMMMMMITEGEKREKNGEMPFVDGNKASVNLKTGGKRGGKKNCGITAGRIEGEKERRQRGEATALLTAPHVVPPSWEREEGSCKVEDASASFVFGSVSLLSLLPLSLSARPDQIKNNPPATLLPSLPPSGE